VCVCLSLAPGSAPVNIAARPISASSVVVEWSEPLIPSGLIKVHSHHLGGVVVSATDLQFRGRGFDSQPSHCHLTTLGKLFTHMCSSN